MNVAVDYNKTEGFHFVDTLRYNVIANNRVQMHTHNLDLALRYGASLAVHCVVESTNFDLIKEFNA